MVRFKYRDRHPGNLAGLAAIIRRHRRELLCALGDFAHGAGGCAMSFVDLEIPFPLTLTLSLGERGQPLLAFRNSGGCRAEARRSFALRRGAFLPLRSI